MPKINKPWNDGKVTLPKIGDIIKIKTSTHYDNGLYTEVVSDPKRYKDFHWILLLGKQFFDEYDVQYVPPINEDPLISDRYIEYLKEQKYSGPFIQMVEIIQKLEQRLRNVESKLNKPT
jgi:hypothetical protein